MHGQGTHTWAKGSKYVGEYKDGKRHGQGTYFYADGDEYVGEWKDGRNTDRELSLHLAMYTLENGKMV